MVKFDLICYLLLIVLIGQTEENNSLNFGKCGVVFDIGFGSLVLVDGDIFLKHL